MLNERQLKIVDLLEQQPRTPGELAQQTGVSGRTILRDIDYLNFTLNGKARIFASGSAGSVSYTHLTLPTRMPV